MSRRFWFMHAWLPVLALCVVLFIAGFTTLDMQFARAEFFDTATGRWRGAGTWWADQLIHADGRNAVRALAAIALVLLLLTWRAVSMRRWRRPLAFFLIAMLASTLIVGGLKQVTNVDCPWDLQGFGGTRPVIHLFEDRPDSLPHAACFPAAHSSSGFALVCCYFLLRHRSRLAAFSGLALGLIVGTVFAFGQEARGAHFLTHDLTSALLVWLICLSIYVRGFGADVAPAEEKSPTTAMRVV